MPLGAKRTFRLAAVVSLSLAIAYGMGMPFPFFAPLFGLLLTATPARPMGSGSLFSLALVTTMSLGVGLLLAPLLRNYPITAVMLIAAGLYACMYISVGLRKGFLGMLLTIGFTMIPAVGLAEHALAVTLIEALVLGIAVAVVCQWLVYPFFPEDDLKTVAPTPPAPDFSDAGWISLRSVLIVLPPLLLALSNPALYLPTIMKTVLLAQQGSVASARTAGHQLVGAIFLAGLYAIVFWFALKLLPNLWMFFLLMLLFGLYFAAKIYGITASRYPATFWQDVVVNMLILLGPAVEDSAAGKDPYAAFAIRFTLFVVVTLYAWGAIATLDWLRDRRRGTATGALPAAGVR